MRRVNVALFASGRGSNAELLIQESLRVGSPYEVVLMVSNNSTCGAMEIAACYDIPQFHISSATHPEEDDYADALMKELDKRGVEMIALAGFMKKIPARVVAHYHKRIINTHPALLPLHGGQGMYGMNVHKAVLAAGEKVSGVTIHYVDEQYDTGSTIAQREVAVLPDDDANALAARVLEQEHELFPQVLRELAEKLQNR